MAAHGVPLVNGSTTLGVKWLDLKCMTVLVGLCVYEGGVCDETLHVYMCTPSILIIHVHTLKYCLSAAKVRLDFS